MLAFCFHSLFFSTRDKPIFNLFTFGSDQKLNPMNATKNPTIRERKFNRTPYLKLKKVKTSPRRTIKQRLRSAIELVISKAELKALV